LENGLGGGGEVSGFGTATGLVMEHRSLIQQALAAWALGRHRMGSG
jgi:hypothetical protein